MKSGKLLIFLFFSLLTVGSLAQSDALFDSANAAYAKADYDKAILQYEQIIQEGDESAELYFNLGNAYYKKEEIARTLINYERALRLQPGDEDILYNLEMASQRTEDKIEAAPEMFLVQWKKSISGIMSESGWSVTCILAFSLALFFLLLYFASSKKRLRQTGFFVAFFMLVITITSFLLAFSISKEDQNRKEAIVTSPSVTVNGEPSEKGTKLFIIHEGCKVNLLQERSDWVEIKIANGNIGWIKKFQLEKI
ncbi:MAG: hypothetical protein M3R27_14300 [Bacteroidota bacterium]|nr:hypothetical protein [Bacteroidota bacterium]